MGKRCKVLLSVVSCLYRLMCRFLLISAMPRWRWMRERRKEEEKECCDFPPADVMQLTCQHAITRATELRCYAMAFLPPSRVVLLSSWFKSNLHNQFCFFLLYSAAPASHESLDLSFGLKLCFSSFRLRRSSLLFICILMLHISRIANKMHKILCHRHDDAHRPISLAPVERAGFSDLHDDARRQSSWSNFPQPD